MRRTAFGRTPGVGRSAALFLLFFHSGSASLQAAGQAVAGDGSAGRVTIAVGRRPIGTAISPDGRFGYVTVNGADQVVVLDLKTAALVSVIPVPYMPDDISVSAEGRYMFISGRASPLGFPYPSDDCSMIVYSRDTGRVTAIDTTTNQIAFVVPITTGVALFSRPNRRGDRLFVATDSGTVETIDLDKRAVVGIAAIGSQGAYDAIVHPDDRRLFLLFDISNPDLAILDTATGEVRTRSFENLGYRAWFGGRVAIDPSGKYLFANGLSLSFTDPSTVVFDTASEEAYSVIPGGYGGLVFSTDGSKAYLFSSEFLPPPGKGGLVVSLPDLGVLGSLPVGGYPAILSGDGNRIFLSQNGGLYRRLIITGEDFRFHYDFTAVSLPLLSVTTEDLDPALIQCSAARAMALSPDGRTLIVTNPALDSVTLVAIDQPPVGLSFYALQPCRILDTREPETGNAGRGPALSASSTRSFPVTGFCGIPATARAVSMNATVTNPAAAGHLTIGPYDLASTASTINYRAGLTRANNATVPMGPLGTVSVACTQLGGGVDLILDVAGYWQ